MADDDEMMDPEDELDENAVDEPEEADPDLDPDELDEEALEADDEFARAGRHSANSRGRPRAGKRAPSNLERLGRYRPGFHDAQADVRCHCPHNGQR